MRLISLALLVLATASCGPRAAVTPVQASAVGAADTCGAAPYLYLIGQDATALERVLILRPVRVNWPDDTPDGLDKADRLNFNISPTGQIRSLTCG